MNLKSLFSLCNATPQRAVNARRQRNRDKILQDVRSLKGSGLLLMYKLTTTYILYLTKAPVQKNQVLLFA